MRAVLSSPALLVATALSVGLARPAAAQAVWQGPEPPCEIRPQHGLVRDAVDHLKAAVESDSDERRLSRLDQAYEAVTRAIREHRQGETPAAWYYLGRYFAYQENAWGADSSFRKVLALAPDCEADVARHRSQLTPQVLAQAIQAWQGGSHDSAATLFQLARRLDQRDADVPYYMAMMYAGLRQMDSAAQYLELGNRTAGDDPSYARRRRQAMLEIARSFERAGLEEPAAQQLAQQRLAQDTVAKAIVRDSTLLAQLIAEWSGVRLRPEARQRVVQDSTLLANRLEAARAAWPSARETYRGDSVAAAGVLDPALAAYERFVEAHPDEGQEALRLLQLASVVGDARRMALATRLVGRVEEMRTDDLAQAALTMINNGYPEHAVALLAIATDRNRFHRTALYLLTRGHYALGRAEASLDAARRLTEVDPLNPESLRMLAATWDLNGQTDSARHYLRQANTGVGWAVNVTQFIGTEAASIVNGAVVNIANRPLGPTALVVEFLGPDGTVAATGTAQIPALQPGGRHALSVRVEQGGAVAWRYRLGG